MSDHHPSGHLSPERAVRVLRAKAGELENGFKNMMAAIEQYGVLGNDEVNRAVTFLTADVALLFSLLADHIENTAVEVERFHAGDQVTFRPQPGDEHMTEPWGPDHPDYDEMGQ